MPLKCCCSCDLIYYGTFPGSSTPDDLTVESGSWSVSGGFLTCSSSSGLVYFTKVLPPTHRLSYRATATQTSGVTIRGIVNFDDVDNYLWGEAVKAYSAPNYFQRPCRVGSRVAGSDTTLGTNTTGKSGVEFTPGICYREAEEVLEYDFDGLIPNAVLGQVWARSVSPIGDKVGLAVSSNTGDVSFDHVWVTTIQQDRTTTNSNLNWITCPHCGCHRACREAPATVTLEPSGVANSFCSGAATVNSTSYVAARNTAGRPCSYTAPANTCPYPGNNTDVYWGGLSIGFNQNPAGISVGSIARYGIISFSEATGTVLIDDRDCSQTYQVTMSNNSSPHPSGDRAFDWDGATIDIIPTL